MTIRLPAPAAPAPFEEYAARFDDLFARRSQREASGAPRRACGCPPSATEVEDQDVDAVEQPACLGQRSGLSDYHHIRLLRQHEGERLAERRMILHECRVLLGDAA